MASAAINGQTKTYTPEEISAVKAKVIAEPVFCEVKSGSRLYSSPTQSAFSERLNKIEKAEILRDISRKWYFVKTSLGEGWIRAENITIPGDSLPSKDELSTQELECYANTQGFKSQTDYFVWVDIHRQRIYIFKGRQGFYKWEKTIACATGRNLSPTTRGFFRLTDRGEWFYSARLKSGAKYWVRFNGNYLFHSVAMDSGQNVTDPTLGIRRSSGCVRMSLTDAKYFYSTMPQNTAVWIN